jgi:hypothetical protein
VLQQRLISCQTNKYPSREQTESYAKTIGFHPKKSFLFSDKQSIKCLTTVYKFERKNALAINYSIERFPKIGQIPYIQKKVIR